MRNTIIILVLLAGFMVSGIFTVDQREVAVATTKAGTNIIYNPGIHWKLPLSNKLEYVYTNLRTSYLALPQPIELKNNSSFKISIIIDWQVINPSQYLDYSNKNSLESLDLQLLTSAINTLTPLAKQSSSISEFEGLLNSKAHNFRVNQAGIEIINLALVNVSVANPLRNAKESANSLETSYYQALKVKKEADDKESAVFAKLRAKDSKFFDYFMQIRHYQMTAESKGVVPSLDKIYK